MAKVLDRGDCVVMVPLEYPDDHAISERIVVHILSDIRALAIYSKSNALFPDMKDRTELCLTTCGGGL